MFMLRAVANGFKKAFVFAGRSTRLDFWVWFGFVVLLVSGISLVLYVSPVPVENQNLQYIVGGILAVPTLSYMSRRLHDLPQVRQTAWLALLLIPGVGLLVLLAWCAGKGHYGPNRYGRDPMDEA